MSENHSLQYHGTMINYGIHNKENGQTTMVQYSVFNYPYRQDHSNTQATQPDWYTKRHTMTDNTNRDAVIEREKLYNWNTTDKRTVWSEQPFSGPGSLGRTRAEENMSLN